MRTHAQFVSVQSVAEIWARAKPEKNKQNNSGGAKSVMLSGVR